MLWITATDLAQWADRRDCQDSLPRVVRLAIHGSGVSIREVDFPAGDSVIYPGLDGYLEAGEGSSFVPAGLSVWEFGTDKDISAKATEDYNKRVGQELGIQRSDAVFVFVTPRRWPKKSKESWLKKKRAESLWRDVTVFDADRLEQWLERTEPAAVWAAEKVGHRPVGMLHSVEHDWALWRSWFEPRATESLVLAGRQDQVDGLRTRLAGPYQPITLKAHSPDEARAFAAAVILTAEQSRAPLLGRTIVVADPAVQLGRLRHLRGQIIVLSDSGSARDHATVLADAGNHVVLCIGNEAPGARVTIELARASHEAFAQALTEMGLSEGEAHQATLASGRSATVLRRRHPSSAFPRPSWAEPDKAMPLLPAMLVGGWDERSEADLVALGHLASADYSAWVTSIAPLCNVPDPPVRRVENVWHLVAPVDACALLVPYLTTSMLDNFAKIAEDVLGEYNPKYDLSPDERVFANIRGKSLSHSGWLRSGIARTLLLLGAGRFTSTDRGTGVSRVRVEAVVRRLLDTPGWQSWASLSSHLPTLAEAAPDPFLQALERRLEGEAAHEFVGIFSEGGGLIGADSPHTGVLWALETLAWNPGHLLRVCLALARLASIDPGGKLANRPLSSLRDILVPWHPGTNAGAAQRLASLDAVLASEPEVGWALLEKLLPRQHDSASPTHTPTWRDFGEAKRETVTRGKANEFRREVVARFLARIGSSPERWTALFNNLGRAFHPDDRAQVPELVQAFATGTASPEAKLAVWSRIRDFVGRHRSFEDAFWSLSPDELTQLEKAASILSPEDPVEEGVWLFDDHYPTLSKKLSDHHERREDIAGERVRVLKKVHERNGDEGIFRLAARAKLPGLVAWSVLEAFPEIDIAERIIDRTKLGDEQERFFASVLSGRAEHAFGTAWRERLIEKATTEAWAPDVIANILRNWPDKPQTWDVSENFGEGVKRAYWSTKMGFPLDDLSIDERTRAVHEYIAAHRALTAIDAVCHGAKQVPASVLTNLLEHGLEELKQLDAASRLAHLRYDIQLLFHALHQTPDADEIAVARLEYQYLPILDEEEFSGSLILYKALSKDPQFFIEVLKHIYKPASKVDEKLDTNNQEQLARRAEMSWRLLDSWHRLPGTGDDGRIDEDELVAWIERARGLAVEADRTVIADLKIGKLLAHAPSDDDGAWPHRAVRRVLENFTADEIDDGLTTERFNMRGVFWRARGKGGAQERELASEARRWVEAVQDWWPRTAVVLEKVAHMCEHAAEREDISQAQEDLR